ncbi:hypothetical protein FH608_003770 [Nonomuraea phyllanthi]|uniref:Uncharacterized protein n=1 Tax=Nonomuraea phyllanthi TaxID=2219224 RepID=A0A5C4WVX0_9ACTN|nr:hypothetical protein [Nonomuraea phyllanthi]KAB8197661.1 hypothetical protein FH608_003770 [Nonomuraea phyllanthi]
MPNWTKLVWIDARNDPRRKTLDWTCHCAEVVYELCAAGGQTYLRRTDTGTGMIDETHRMSPRAGYATWHALLTGLVR